jgi:hypothetical protein
VMEAFYKQVELDEYQRQMNWREFFTEAWKKICTLANSYLCPRAVVAALIVGCFMIFSSKAARWSVMLCAGVAIVQMLCTPWMRLQYMAPLVGFFNLLALVGLWTMWQWRSREFAWGKWLVIFLLIAYGCEAVYRDVRYALTIPLRFGNQRAKLIDQWSQRPENILVIVHYSPTHLSNFEEVFNGADIDGSKVVFARDLGTEDDLKLIQYFHDRTVFYWDVDYQELKRMQ